MKFAYFFLVGVLFGWATGCTGFEAPRPVFRYEAGAPDGPTCRGACYDRACTNLRNDVEARDCVWTCNRDCYYLESATPETGSGVAPAN